jgi:PHD/YefM family antitoxin component YafN of YafNO toxin-antitoxin module
MKEPVTVTNHSREELVMLPLEQRAFHASQMTAHELAALDTVVIPAESVHHNQETA